MSARWRSGSTSAGGLRQVREHVEPELAEIDGHEEAPRRLDERAADHRHLGRAARHAREVGRHRDQLAGEAAREVELRVDAAVGADVLAQRDDPRVAEAAEEAPPDDERDDRVRVLDLLERLGRRRPAGLRVARDGELQLLEQDAAELLRRVDVERVAGDRLDLRGEIGVDLGERCLGAVEAGRIDNQAAQLHAHERLLECEVLVHVRAIDVRDQRVPDRARGRGEQARVGAGALGRQRAPRLALLADAAHGVLLGQRAAERVTRDERQVVRRPVGRLRHVRRAHRVAGDAAQRDTGAVQHAVSPTSASHSATLAGPTPKRLWTISGV
jgi:hypothetical protein